MINNNSILVLPFIILLLTIAFGPLFFKNFWDKNYSAVSFSLSAIVILFYLFIFNAFDKILFSLHDYFSFIVLIGSLYFVSGGILISLKGKSTPKRNLIFLAISAIISNLIGTTGASMLLIRPFIKLNQNRIRPFHIVFFIFIVSNIGGMLTPIGDPPLFIGYLKGIPFLWYLNNIFFSWFVAVILILVIFYFFDLKEFKNHTNKFQHDSVLSEEKTEIKGGQNIGFLILIILAVFIQKPIFVRESIMILSTIISYYFTKKEIHEKNEFSIAPIKEVAVLFFGIFITLVPALDWIILNSKNFGLTTPTHFYWTTGFLSSVLDNAPTFLNSMALAMGSQNLNINFINDVALFLKSNSIFVIVISFSAVAFGAITYIGNGPNLLVKSIAEDKKIEMPNFIEYILKYSLPILIPIYFLIWILFF